MSCLAEQRRPDSYESGSLEFNRDKRSCYASLYASTHRNCLCIEPLRG